MTEKVIHLNAETDVTVDLPDTAEVDAHIKALRRELDVLHGEVLELQKADEAYNKSATGRINWVVDIVGDRLKAHDKRLASIDANQGRFDRRICKIIDYFRKLFGQKFLQGED